MAVARSVGALLGFEGGKGAVTDVGLLVVVDPDIEAREVDIDVKAADTGLPEIEVASLALPVGLTVALPVGAVAVAMAEVIGEVLVRGAVDWAAI